MFLIGKRLKQLRKSRGILQKQMADLLEVSERHYRNCESGKVDLPSSKFIALADYFNVSLDYLAGRSDAPRAEYSAPRPRLKAILELWEEADSEEKKTMLHSLSGEEKAADETI
jgi:transcriptional regulator with XRE-family HTH domain